MGSLKTMLTLLFVLLMVISFNGCTAKQDETNFKKYLSQDTEIKGKAGVLMSALGQPEEYEFEFFNNYLQLIFNNSFPPFLKFIIMRDSGTVLRDPDNLWAEEEFKPKTLIDCFAKSADKAGTPYTDLEYSWVKSRGEGKPGHFVIKEKNGLIDAIEKTGIKMTASYYARMPGNKISYRHQHEPLFRDIKALIEKDAPGTPVETAWVMYPKSIETAIEKLIEQKVETIVVCDLFPVYSSLEEFNSYYVEVEHLVHGRAKVVYTPYPGAFKNYRNAYVEMAMDEVSRLSKDEKKLVMLTRHGMPIIKGEPFHKLSNVYYGNLKKEVESALKDTNTDVLIADVEFADEERDPKDKLLAASEAVEMALEKKYDKVVLLLIDFMTENTDTVYCVREEALEPIGCEFEGTVPYTDFDNPYRTEVSEGDTTFIIAGTPVGDKYRPHIALGVYDTIATVLQSKKWPELIVE